MNSKWKVGFLVEGDMDKLVIETLAARILKEGDMHLNEKDVRVHAVRSGGKATLRWAYSTIYFLLQNKKFNHVIVVLDADTRYAPELARQREKVERMLREHDLEDDEVSVCFATPELEAWLLARHLKEPEDCNDAKAELCKRLRIARLTPEHAAEEARQLNIVDSRRRSPSFEKFCKTLENVIRRLQTPSAAA